MVKRERKVKISQKRLSHWSFRASVQRMISFSMTQWPHSDKIKTSVLPNTPCLLSCLGVVFAMHPWMYI